MCTSWIRCLLSIIAFAFVELELKVIHVIRQKERLWLVGFFYCIHMKNDTSLANSANGKVRNFGLFFSFFPLDSDAHPSENYKKAIDWL